MLGVSDYGQMKFGLFPLATVGQDVLLNTSTECSSLDGNASVPKVFVGRARSALLAVIAVVEVRRPPPWPVILHFNISFKYVCVCVLFCFLTFIMCGWKILCSEGFSQPESHLLPPVVVAKVHPPLPLS